MAAESFDRSTTDEYTDHEKPWRNRELLRSLYWEQGLSLREVGAKLGPHPETIRTWLHRTDLGTRKANEQKTQPSYWSNSAGYLYFSDGFRGEKQIVGEHELAAIAAGYDPHEVFSDDTHTHHTIIVPSSFEVKFDIPRYTEVRSAIEHLQEHGRGECETKEFER